MKKLRSALALLLEVAMLLTAVGGAEEMLTEAPEIPAAEAEAPEVEEAAPPEPEIPEVEADAPTIEEATPEPEVPEIEEETPAPEPGEAPGEPEAAPDEADSAEPEWDDGGNAAPAQTAAPAPDEGNAGPACPPEADEGNVPTPTPAPTAPEIVVAPGWDYDAAARLISIPCSAEDEAVTFEWRFNGAPSLYLVETTAMAPDGAEGPRTEIGYTVESFVMLPVAEYAEGWHVLYVTAALEDGTQLTAAQAFRLLVRGASPDAPEAEATPAPEVSPEPVETPNLFETAEASPSPEASGAPTEGEPTPDVSVEPSEEPESTQEPEDGEYGIATVSMENNQSDQNYDFYWSSPMETYLVPVGDGYMALGLTRDRKQILIKYFDSSYNRTSYQYIDAELSLFGGFYAGPDAYYLVFGQENLQEDDSVEVIRVVKYNKSWERQSAASLRGANTYIPFDAGNLRMEEYGGYLYVRTSHEMYDNGDGLHHQANMTIQIQTSDMTIVDCHSEVDNITTGYVSHSFNQFILTDDEGYLVGLDHGDGYPRAIVLGRYPKKAGSPGLIESVWDDYTAVNVFPLYGEKGDNYTGATVGGLEYSSSHYLVAGSSLKQDGSGSRTYNIFVTATSRSDFSEGGTSLRWITSYSEGGELTASTPQLVKMGPDSFLLLWETAVGQLSYVFLDGSGRPVGDVHSESGYLSDCKPTVKGGKAIWFVTDSMGMTFYTVGSDGSFTGQIKDYAETAAPGGSFGENNALRWTIDYNGTLTISGNGSMGDIKRCPWNDDIMIGAYVYGIKKAIIEDGVTDIATNAFSNCESLTSVSIPNSVTRIGDYAFRFCNIKSITVPASVQSISTRAFHDSGSLAEINVDSENPNYASKDGVLFNKRMTTLIYYPLSKSGDTYAVPDTVSDISSYAFEDANYLKSLVLPENVRSIQGYAFYFCDSLISVTIKNPYCWMYGDSSTLGAPDRTVVKCYEGSTADSFAKKYGYAVEYLPPDPPEILSVVNVANGIQMNWDVSYGAVNYRVEVKAGSGSWTAAGTTTSTSYTWTGEVQSGTAYQIRVQCVSEDGSAAASDYSAVESITYLAAPALKSVANTSEGILVTWDASAGATKYRVEYKTGRGDWTIAGATASTSFTLEGAVGGAAYQLRVCCVSDDEVTVASAYSAEETITFIAAPVITAVTNVSNGIQVTWEASAGAVNYRVEYKSGSGSWTAAGTTASTSFTWTGAAGGAAYEIRVLCVSANGSAPTSGYSAARSITYLAAPVLKSVTNRITGIQVSWEASAGATNYRVEYKTGRGDWTLAGTTASTDYTWTGMSSGGTYRFRVCCGDDAEVASAYSAEEAITYVAAPQIASVTALPNGIQVTWEASVGAVNYGVEYRIGSGSWATAGTTDSTSFTWTEAKSGNTYEFRLVCLSADGRSAVSGYSATKSITYLVAPVFKSVANVTSGIQLSWEPSAGAAKYRVEYRIDELGSGDWDYIEWGFDDWGNDDWDDFDWGYSEWMTAGITDSTSFTWTEVESGTIYQFRICCVSEDGETVSSAYSARKSMPYIAAPRIQSVAPVSSGIQVRWESSIDSINYRVEYKTSTGKWTSAGTTKSTSFTWKKAKSGTTYEIRVLCVTKNGKKVISSSDAVSITYQTAPKLKSVANAATGIQVSWSTSSGAAMYRVEYRPAAAIGRLPAPPPPPATPGPARRAATPTRCACSASMQTARRPPAYTALPRASSTLPRRSSRPSPMPPAASR